MIKNYLLVAIRNLWRNKIFSLINILGLSIGISAALVIFQVVLYDFSFEKFQKDGDRIYRIVSVMHFPNQEFKNSGVSGPLIPAARQGIPGIEASTTFWNLGEMKVKIPSQDAKNLPRKKQSKIIFADDQYFKFLPYEWIAGSAATALSEAHQVVLTESRARTYFGNGDLGQVIGKTIVYDDSILASVTGIVKDLDKDRITDFNFKEFISLPTYLTVLKERSGYEEWGSVSSASQFLVRLKKGVAPSGVEKKLNEIRKNQAKNAYLETSNYLQPLRDIHFNADYDNFDQRLANKKVLFGLVAVAAFLLLLGCINFINLTTAQSSRRAREIGIRKTMGSSISQLIFQFLGETLLLTLVASLLSFALMPLIFKFFSTYIPAGLDTNLLGLPKIIGFMLVLALLVTLLSGFYPAMVLSRYQPAMVLKNQAFSGGGQGRKAWLRKVLTVSQFAIAQFFIIATLVVGKQIHYSINMDMGFSKEAIIDFQAPFDYFHPDNKRNELLEKLRTVPGVQKISLAGPAPASNNMNMTTMKFIKDGKTIETTVEVKQIDTCYLDLFKMKLLAGRNIRQSDTTQEYLVNEAYARFLGYRNPADIVGQYVERGKGENRIPVVGLVADFLERSTQSPIKPLVFNCQAKYHSVFHIFLGPKGKNTDNWKNTIARVEKTWKEFFPDHDFDYKFFDDSIAKFYTAEQQTSSLLNWCTGLSVFISCLGLLGLVIYTTTLRTKEIGVRKVLGASVSQIVSLLSRDFLLLVMLAFIIASPLAWWAMHVWLQNYAYRTGISWWIFIVTCCSMMLIAFFTLSMQTIRSAMDNPVKSLRTE